MIRSFRTTDSDWQARALADIAELGIAVIEDVLSPDLIERTRAAMYRVQAAIERDVGPERLARAGEIGVLRLMMRYEPVLFDYLALPPMLAMVEAMLGPTCILHLQNGFILPAQPPGTVPRVFQNSLHRDFPRFLSGYVASVNAFFALDDFDGANGATLFLPGSHQQAERPASLVAAEAAHCSAGAMILFDSTLWHAAGENVSGRDRLAINQQFTRSFIKQQLDYCRALPASVITALPERSQQLLGWWTRVPASLDDYYKPPAERLYRSGQG